MLNIVVALFSLLPDINNCNGVIMQKKLWAKFLLPTLAGIIVVFIIMYLLISSITTDMLEEKAAGETHHSITSVESQLELSDDLVLNQVRAGMGVLVDEATQKGQPELDGMTEIRGKSVPDLKFGGTSQTGNFSIVDEVKTLTGNTATLFVRSGSDYIRVSTNVVGADGERAVSTALDPAGKAYAAISSGSAFYGLVNILGKPYLTGYEPIKDASGTTIGVYYIGIQLTALEKLGQEISSMKVLLNGFVALLNEKGDVIFHSANTNPETVQKVFSSTEDQWVIEKKDFTKWGYQIVAAYPESDFASLNASVTSAIIVSSIISTALLILIIAFLVFRIVIRRVNKLDAAAAKMAGGDHSVTLESLGEDELGRLATTFNAMTENIRKSIHEIEAQGENLKVALEESKIAKENAEKQEAYLQGKTEEILVAMDKFAQGDLTVSLDNDRDDDIKRLFNGFSNAVAGLRDLIAHVQETAAAAASASNQINSSTEEMAAGVQEQSMQTTEVAGAIEEMARTIVDNTRSANAASDASMQAGSKAKTGGRVVYDTIEGINRIADVVSTSAETVFSLGQNSDKIGEIVQVIDDIADQTNLLALNAAIEAARAGEQGRGFAVVADEVRKLAERTTKATKEIADMINQIQRDTANAVSSMKAGSEEVAKGKALANQAGEVLKEIIAEAESVTEIAAQVAAASEEQSATAEQIGKNIENINNVAQESSNGIRQIAQAAEDLSRLTNELEGMVNRFNLGSARNMQPRKHAYLKK